jgi:hypothetical protein
MSTITINKIACAYLYVIGNVFKSKNNFSGYQNCQRDESYRTDTIRI